MRGPHVTIAVDTSVAERRSRLAAHGAASCAAAVISLASSAG